MPDWRQEGKFICKGFTPETPLSPKISHFLPQFDTIERSETESREERAEDSHFLNNQAIEASFQYFSRELSLNIL